MSRFTGDARSMVSGQRDVGHEGVITGRDGFSLRSPIANPQGVAQPPLQSTYIQSKFSFRIFMVSLLFYFCYMRELFLQILFSQYKIFS
ncbi:hypothetical protein [Lysinibacillus sp. RC79]|uniref:hypothetical protein n=1 Tax=Lysinibacillus sp. RC79 TaxID=3156296 RepID=UPI00351958D5